MPEPIPDDWAGVCEDVLVQRLAQENWDEGRAQAASAAAGAADAAGELQRQLRQRRRRRTMQRRRRQQRRRRLGSAETDLAVAGTDGAAPAAGALGAAAAGQGEAVAGRKGTCEVPAEYAARRLSGRSKRVRAVKPRRARVRAANAAGVAAAAAAEAAAAAMATANVALLCTLQANYVRDQGGGAGAQEKAAEGGERSRNSHRRGNCTGVGRWKQKWRWKHERRRVRELRDVAAGRAGLQRWLDSAAAAPARWSGAARLARRNERSAASDRVAWAWLAPARTSSVGADRNMSAVAGQAGRCMGQLGVPLVGLLFDATCGYPGEGHEELMQACARGDVEAVKQLLGNGADATLAAASGQFEGCTAIMRASAVGHAAVVQALVAAGAPVDHVASTGQCTGWNALMLAGAAGHVEAASVLLNGGADPRYVARSGRRECYTALMLASMRGWEDVVQLLTHAGADVTAVNANGETASALAAAHKSKEAQRAADAAEAARLGQGASEDEYSADESDLSGASDCGQESGSSSGPGSESDGQSGSDEGGARRAVGRDAGERCGARGASASRRSAVRRERCEQRPAVPARGRAPAAGSESWPDRKGGWEGLHARGCAASGLWNGAGRSGQRPHGQWVPWPV